MLLAFSFGGTCAALFWILVAILGIVAGVSLLCALYHHMGFLFVWAFHMDAGLIEFVGQMFVLLGKAVAALIEALGSSNR